MSHRSDRPKLNGSRLRERLATLQAESDAAHEKWAKKYPLPSEHGADRGALPDVPSPLVPGAPLGELLRGVGAFGCLKVECVHPSGYRVVLKLNVAGRGPVYRMGDIADLNGLIPLIELWVQNGYWTTDKYPLRVYQYE